MYKIRWEGYESSDDSWVNEEDTNCVALIQKFEELIKRGADAVQASFSSSQKEKK